MCEKYVKLLFGLLLWMADLRDASGSGKLPLCSETTKEGILCSIVDDYSRVKVPQVPTEYFSEFSLNGVQEINEEKHTVTFMMEYGMSWEDKRLALSNSTYQVELERANFLTAILRAVYRTTFFFHPKTFFTSEI